MQLEKNKWDLFLERGVLLTYMAGAISVATLWKYLPEQVPMYFNWPGKIEGFTGTIVYFETLLFMGLVSLGLYKLSHKPIVLNSYANRPMEEGPYGTLLIRRMLQTINLAIALTWFVFSMSSLQEALETQIVDLAYLVSGLPFILMGIPLIYTVLLLRWKWGLIKGNNDHKY